MSDYYRDLEEYEQYIREVEEPRDDSKDWILVGGAGESASVANDFKRATRVDETALPGNTATYSSQESDSNYESGAAGGVDMLEVTCYGSFGAGYWETEKRMEAARMANMRGDRAVVEIMGAGLHVREKGHRWGKAFFPWVCDADGITISLNRQHTSEKVPVAKVQIGSLRLMRDGHKAAWKSALRILESVGVYVSDTTVARIDLCLDQPGVEVGRYCEAIWNKQVITRIKSEAKFYRSGIFGDWTGVSVGSRSDVHIRIYDKLAELRKGGPEADAKWAVMLERRWGIVPKAATRVEFQINGQWLRAKWQNCRTVEEVFDRLDSILAYLCREYFRIVVGEVDRECKNQSRSVVDEMWEGTSRDFLAWVEGASIELEKFVKRPVDRSKVGRRLFSAALSVAALAPDRVVCRQSFLQEVCDNLIRHMGPDWEWKAKLRERLDKWEVSGNAGVFSCDNLVPVLSCGFEVQLWDVSGYGESMGLDDVPEDSEVVEGVPF